MDLRFTICGQAAAGADILRSPRDTRPRGVASPSPLNGERAGVRGETVENAPIPAAHLPDDRPHLTLPSPLPPGAERENCPSPVAYPVACSVRRRRGALPSRNDAVGEGERDRLGRTRRRLADGCSRGSWLHQTVGDRSGPKCSAGRRTPRARRPRSPFSSAWLRLRTIASLRRRLQLPRRRLSPLLNARFPLPRGEGQGEGEGNADTSKSHSPGVGSPKTAVAHRAWVALFVFLNQ
jgi:hypothetical protein